MAERLEGRTLGEFTLRDKIGEGGFAVVHRAFQATLEREAVVKVLHTRLAARADVIQRFLRESRLASRLDHPYAAHVYAFGAETDGTLWIAMELVRGTPMDKLLEQQGAIPLDRFVPLFERICEVVQTAHERGIIHRDIKPANVMVLSRAGRLLPKLLDFGIARVLEPDHHQSLARPSGRASETPDHAALATLLEHSSDDPAHGADPGLDETVGGAASLDRGREARATRVGAVMGSPLYMAPEQWTDAGSVGQTVDIYALGVLAYEALTGRVPFPATSLEEVMIAHARDGVPPLGGDHPEALNAVLARALAKQPEDRYATAGDFAAALRAAAGKGDGDALPQLDEAVREAMTAGAPQPLAEAIAALEAARNIDQACAILWDVVLVATRWIGALALAARTKIGPGGDDDARDVHERLRALGRGDVSDEDWLALARALTRPFCRRRAAYPIPEIVTLLHGDLDLAITPSTTLTGDPGPPFVEAFHRVRTLRGALDRRGGRSDEQRRELYAEALTALAGLLRPLRFILDYTLIVTRKHCAERWCGPRRSPRLVTVRRARPLPEGEAFLLDSDGAPVLKLTPLVQTAPPAPGKDEELFLFDGRDAHGARLVAVPHGFERHDEMLDRWFREHLVDVVGDGTATVADEAAPYRGLATFTTADSGFYFGRELEVDAFVNRLRVEGFLAVVGPSGAGKSSFVQAGVVSRLPTGWRAIAVRPGQTPSAALAARLGKHGVDTTGMATDPRLLGERLRATAAREGSTIVLVIDQLEEMFTLCKNPDERTAFAEALVGCASSDDDVLRVVVTLRDDFLIRAEAEPSLRERLGRGIKLLTIPSTEDLQRILVEPAKRVGYQFEDGALVTDMVTEVANQPGALALLSFTAAELWKLRDRHFHQLSRKSYTAIGGVGGALARHAETTLAELSSDEQRLMREAFRHLVTAEGTRQVLQLAELQQLLAPGMTNQKSRRAATDSDVMRANAVIDRLIAARLVVISEEAGGGQSVEVIHEALLSAWPRLVEWRREDSEGARLRDQLRTAARQWDSRGRSRGLLWRDESLAEYRIWRVRYPGALTVVEDEFGTASVAAATRGRRIQRSVMVAAFLVLGVGLTVMFQLRQGAEEQRGIAQRRLVASYVDQGRQALMASDHARAAAYLLEARRIGGETKAVRFMLERATKPLAAHLHALELDAGSVWAAAYDPTGDLIATAHDNGQAAVWLARDGSRLAVIAASQGTVFDVAFSPDGSKLATAGADGRVRLWRPRTGEEIGSTRPFELPVVTVQFAAGGVVVAGGWNGQILFWNPTTDHRTVRELGAEGECYVAVSADGSKVVAMVKSSPLITIFDVASGQPLTQLRAPANAQAGAFSADGRRVAVADSAGTATVWDWSEAEQPVFSVTGHDGMLDHLAYSPDGRLLVTAGRDRMARVWDADTGRKVSVLAGHVGIVWRALFSPDSKLVFTMGGAGEAAMWEASSGRRVALFEGHTSLIVDGVFSPDGNRVTTASWDGLAHEWGVRDQYQTFERSALEQACSDRVDVGRFIAIACPQGTRVWDLDRGQLTSLPPAHRIAMAPSGRVAAFSGAAAWQWQAPDARTELPHPTELVAIAISTDGERVATVDRAHVLRMWRHGVKVWERSGPAWIRTLAFAPAGDLFASGDYESPAAEIARFDLDTGEQLSPLILATPANSMRFVDRDHLITVAQVLEVWDLRGLRRVATLTGHVGVVNDVKLSSDGSRVVTTSGDATARIWRFPSGQLVSVLAGSPQFLTSADFAPSGNVVVTAGGDNMMRFWEPDTGQLLWTLASREPGELIRFADEHSVMTMSSRGGVARWDLSPARGRVLERGLPCWAPSRFDRDSGRAIPREGDGC